MAETIEQQFAAYVDVAQRKAVEFGERVREANERADVAVARAERAEALLERLIRAYKEGTTDDMARVLAAARAALDAGDATLPDA